MAVLVALAGRQGDLAGKRELLDEVWGGAEVSEAVLTNAVAELRRGIALLGCDRGLVETVPRRGYRVTAPVLSDDAVPLPLCLAVLPFEDLPPRSRAPRC
jgi:DNA-binding winged helix-turn-helix (wHTH) protein